MTALPTLKMRVLPTFPASVIGDGIITVTKVAGLYTISFSVTSLGLVAPAASQYRTDYLLAYDSVQAVFINIPLSSLGVGGQRVQRSVTATPITISDNDQILNCNINADATCALPISSTRNGVPLTFKDLGHATVHNITITPNGAERIDGLASVKLTTNYEQLTLVPFNDGTNSGWAIL